MIVMVDLSKFQGIEVEGEKYDFVKDEARIVTEYLVRARERLGIPEDLHTTDLSPIVWQYINVIVKTWKSYYPHEFTQWVEALKNELAIERPVEQAVKSGGYFPVSYPYRLVMMFKALVPGIKIQDKKFFKKLISMHPEFKSTNYAVGTK